MLSELHIRNLAVVEDVSLSFAPGLNVLTGSTGAGKSLILSAINLLLGEKSSPEIIRAGADRAEVEAVFTGAAGIRGGGGSAARGKASASAAAGTASMRLRREVRAGGRGRAWRDARPVTVRELHDAAASLVEPHGQNEQFRLRDPATHVAYVDAAGGHGALLADYAKAHAAFLTAQTALAEFEREMAALNERRELLEHRVGEVERVRPRAGEREELETRLRVMENAERIVEALAGASDAVYENDESAASVVGRYVRQIQRIAGVDERIAGFAAALEAAQIALRDCSEEMRAYLETIEFDADDLREAQARLGTLLELERRYGLPCDELAAACVQWKRDLDGLGEENTRRAALRRTLTSAAGDVASAAQALGRARRDAARRLDRAVTAELQSLMMEGAHLRTEVRFVRDDTSAVVIDGVGVGLGADGADEVRMMIRANPGEDEGPLDRVASTGELSRVALALKRVANAGGGSVMIFDEIDAGVGADLGAVIAQKLLELGARYQIICITHMPQIAAKADRHLVVAKRRVGRRTVAMVSPVEGPSRQREIARMLGGEQGSDHRMALAGELLADRRHNVRP